MWQGKPERKCLWGSVVPPPSWVYFQVLPEHRDPSCAGVLLPFPSPFCCLWSPLSQAEVWGRGDPLSLTEAQQSWGFCCLPTKNLVPESHHALSNRFLPESSNESWLKSPNQTVFAHFQLWKWGNQSLLLAAWNSLGPLGGSVTLPRPLLLQRRPGRREKSPGSGTPMWGEPGSQCPGLSARELPPQLIMLSSVFLHFRDDCPTQNKLKN